MDLLTVWVKTKSGAMDFPELAVAWDEYAADTNSEGYNVEVDNALNSYGSDLDGSRVIQIPVPDEAVDGAFTKENRFNPHVTVPGSHVRLLTAWVKLNDGDETPELLTAWDEFLYEGNPEGFLESVDERVKAYGSSALAVRHIVFSVPAADIEKAFSPVRLPFALAPGGNEVSSPGV